MIYMFLANGFEETEALVTVDMLRRAGIAIKTCGVTGAEATGSHGITVKADVTLNDAVFADLTGVILPGGMPGTTNLLACEKVTGIALRAYESGHLVCAICAAPMILGKLGILKGKKAVCYPGFEGDLAGAELFEGKAVTDKNVITAKAAGAVYEFSHNIITYVCGKEVADRVISEVYY